MSSAPKQAKKKRNQIRSACGACRSRKSACDGKRPACDNCLRRDIPCSYATRDPCETRDAVVRRELDETTRRVKEYQDVLRYLREAPELNAQGFLHAIRRHADLSTALGRLPRSIPPTWAASGDAVYWEPGPTPPSCGIAPPQGDRLPTPTCGRLLPSGLGAGPGGDRDWEGDLDPMLRSADEAEATGDHVSCGTPFPPEALYCDERLRRLNVGCWTDVAVSNGQAAAIISLYLETDHPILGFFDADVFVEDLIFHTNRFCSPLLVNALLFWASQAYSCRDATVAPLVPLFLREAQRSWNSSRAVDSITTASAAQILSIGCSCIGQNGLGTAFLVEGADMARRLGLLGRGDDGYDAGSWDPAAAQEGAAHVAWGIFNWLALRSFQFHDFTVTRAPDMPIPGEGGPSTASPATRTFAALCRFWPIANRVTLLYHREGDDASGPGHRIPLSCAEEIYVRLMQWTVDHDSLWTLDAPAPHHVAIIHIYLQCVIMDTFRPFLAPPRRHPPSRADTLFAASLAQLRRHLTLFPSLYPRVAEHSILWHLACVYVINAVLSPDPSPHHRPTLGLCLDVYLRLSRVFPVALALLEGFLAMAIRGGSLGLADARALHERATRPGRRLLVASADAAMDLKIDLRVSEGGGCEGGGGECLGRGVSGENRL